MSASAIVFDFDGTLVDSAPTITAVANAVAAEMGLEPLTVAEIISYIGRGADVFVQRLLRARGRDDEASFDDAVARFRQHYAAPGGEPSAPMPGAADALVQLAARGHRLGLCTNKPTRPTELELDGLGWHARFSAIVCGDTLDVRKPDPAPLSHAIALLGGGQAVFVGDSETDAETAERAGVPFLLFTEGYRATPAEALVQAGRFNSFAELPDLIASLN